MKAKTKSTMLKTKNHNAELKTFWPYAMALHFSLCIFSFLLLPPCLSTSLADAESSPEHVYQDNSPTHHLSGSSQDVNTPRTPNQAAGPQPNRQGQSQAGGFTIPGNTTSPAAGQLRQAILSVPEGKKDNRNKDELKRLIRQIRSIEFKSQKTSEPTVVVKPALTTEPNKTSSDAAAHKKETEAKLPYEPIADQTLQILKNLSQHPDKVNNPFQLADILFLDGRLKEAAIFYQEALNRIGKEDVRSADDRAWILFQIGTCLRNDDLTTAMKAYRQLITEYPSSPWTELAKALEKLIDWYQKDKPRESIAERKL